MRIIVPHHKTQEEAKDIIDRFVGELFSGAGGSVKIVDQKKVWKESTMDFSFTGKMGFMSLPVAGTVAVDQQNVTIDCELPGMIKNLVGENKIRTGVEQKLKTLLKA